MRLLDFIEQHHAVGLAPHLFGQLAALVKPHISRRRTDELDTVCRSIYSDISSRMMDSSSPNIASAKALESSVLPARGAQEDEGANGPVRVFQARARPADRLETACTASSCPITRAWSRSSKCRSF